MSINNKWCIIDKTGKMILSPIHPSIDSFREGLARFSCFKNSTYYSGYLDTTGKVAIQPVFDGAEAFFNGVAEVRVGDKTAYIDRTGKLLVEPL